MPTLQALEWIGRILAVVGPCLAAIIWVVRHYSWIHRIRTEAVESQKALATERSEHANEVDGLRRERDNLSAALRDKTDALDELRHKLTALKASRSPARLPGLDMSAETAGKFVSDLQKSLETRTDHLHQATAKSARLEVENASAQEQLANARIDCESLRRQLAEQRTISDQLSQEMERREEEWSRATEDLSDRLGQLERLGRELAEVRRRADEAEDRLLALSRLDGRLWLRPSPLAPAFQPLALRKTAIVSLLNLKGGVGKTTIAANLAATLGAAGKRVLLIDLDFQRSLSMLLLNEQQRQLLHYKKKCVQHILGGEDRALKHLLACAESVGDEAPRCSIITNTDIRDEVSTDSLEEVETRLMVEWLVNSASQDIRFHLRRALHEPGLSDAYEYVILDCPPRLTTACVNAVAASDFVLIPVVPDAVSTRAVENLFRSLARLRSTVCPDLNLLGIIPNMVQIHGSGPIQAQQAALGDLKSLAASRQVWPEPVPVFKSTVPSSNEFVRTAAALEGGASLRLALRDAKVKAAFTQLAREFQTQVSNHEGHRPETVPSKSGVHAESRR